MQREFYNDDGFKIGWLETIDDQIIFRKKVKESKHLMRKLDAWGVDESVYEQLRQAWCEKLQILDTDTNTLYEIPFNRFEQNAITRDFGYGRQAFVPRRHFDTKKHGQRTDN
jgi:hypothetical protein